jgi:phosphoserine phosphatase/uracil phosphoribosyltransferase
MSTTNDADAPQTVTITQNRPPTIIGIYGVSGCGKSYLSKQLKAQLGETTFSFYEGSEQLLKTFGSHLPNFQRLPKPSQDLVRASTIEGLSRECTETGKTGIITGHYAFWDASIGLGPGGPSTVAKDQVVMTDADKKAYTHILYSKPSPETIVEQVAKDSTRRPSRPQLDVAAVREWQAFEEEQLTSICRENDILFMTVKPTHLTKTIARIQDAVCHNEATNVALVDDVLDKVIQPRLTNDVKNMLVLNADGTLAPYDASTLYWQWSDGEEGPLKALFQSPLGYSYTAFRQMTWLYEQHDDFGGPGYFQNICAETAPKIKVHPPMFDLLKRTRADKTVDVVIVTCGIKPIWEKVIEALDLSGTVPIIGNGLLSNGHVVTPMTKADIVSRLKHHYKLHVCAVGDSEVDLPMLKEAHQALVVMGPESSRSKSFDAKLQNAIDNEGLRARQVMLPPGSTPTLNTNKLPTVKLGQAFLAALSTHDHSHSLKFYDASDKPAAKLLASNTRSANVYGLALQHAHENAGWYLATEYISLALDVESFEIMTVEGRTSQGHRLFDESKTLIVPFMRGGDPIARGVFKAFPEAMYHHAKEPEQLEPEHVAGKNTIILADWAINTGKGMIDFVKHIRENFSSQIRIVMVAGVVQEEVIRKDGMDGLLVRELAGMGDVSLVALRISKNKYTGTGGTDTGHRLFNSTHLV